MTEYVDAVVGLIFFTVVFSKGVQLVLQGRQKLRDAEQVDKDKD